MKDKSKVIFSLIVIAVIFVGVKAIGNSQTTPIADNSTNKAAIMRIEVQSCVTEATKTVGNVYTAAEIQQYCNCTMEDLMGDKTVAEIRQMDKEYNESLTISPAMEASINKCIAQL